MGTGCQPDFREHLQKWLAGSLSASRHTSQYLSGQLPRLWAISCKPATASCGGHVAIPTASSSWMRAKLRGLRTGVQRLGSAPVTITTGHGGSPCRRLLDSAPSPTAQVSLWSGSITLRLMILYSPVG